MLTAQRVQKAKTADPPTKPYKLTDQHGLYLHVMPEGGKYWRWNYSHNGKERTLALGTLADVTLAEARDKHDQLRKLLKSGVDPSAERKRIRLTERKSNANTFESVAREWYEKSHRAWTERHAGYVLRRMESDLFPDLGAVPISDLSAPLILAVLRKIERRGAHEMARRNRQYVSAVCCFAIADGRAQNDPAAHLTKALEKPPEGQHLKALDLRDLPSFFKKLAKYDGHPQTAIAIKLLILTATRTSELVGARWSEIDGDVWRIPAERMKMKRAHIVPLCKQAMALLKELRVLSGESGWLFPARNLRTPMSNNTILFALYRMGYHGRATGHGFRTTFSTAMNEANVKADVIERQLAHVPGDAVRGAYNRAEWLPERRRMMTQWGNMLVKAGL